MDLVNVLTVKLTLAENQEYIYIYNPSPVAYDQRYTTIEDYSTVYLCGKHAWYSNDNGCSGNSSSVKAAVSHTRL